MSNQQQTQKENIFKGIEKTAENYLHQMRKLAETAQKSIKNQANISKFETAYAFSLNKEQRTKTMSEVKEVRSELWNQAIKEANGDINVASNIYDRLCSFP